jgi:large subunit ribosomal protein L25
MVKGHDIELLLQRHRSESLILDLEVEGGKALKALLKEVQRDPVSDHVLHADFMEISMTRKMRVRVPIVLLGEPVGVTQDAGVLDHTLRDLEVECLPADLREAIEVDVAAMKIGNTILVKDLALPSGMAALTDGGIAVASVHAQRLVEEAPVAEEAVPAEGAAPAEPEVIGETKREQARQEKEAEEALDKGEKPKGGKEDKGKGAGGKEDKGKGGKEERPRGGREDKPRGGGTGSGA